MANTLSPAQRQRNVLAAQERHNPGSPEAETARRDLAAINLEEYVRKTVDSAPMLTGDQRARIAGLLFGGGGEPDRSPQEPSIRRNTSAEKISGGTTSPRTRSQSSVDGDVQ